MKTKEYEWMIAPFRKQHEANPCLSPNTASSFHCPVRNCQIHWEAKDVFNAAAVVKNDKIYLLYRAEDFEGKYAGTSRIGLASSTDGLHFTTEPQPVLYPDNDAFSRLEWEGGCEDPRIVETEDGVYYVYYTAYDGETAILCCAYSRDLHSFTKCGPIFAKAFHGKYAGIWSKSGSVVCRQKGEHFYPVKIQDKYRMYWGEGNIYTAVSDDLINWEPVEFAVDENTRVLLPVVTPRKNNYDSVLCEPGPQAILTDDGIVLLYNGKGANPEQLGGHDTKYDCGQLLLDPENPTCVLARTRKPFLSPRESYEISGQVMPTCFIEGLVFYQGKYFLYYGTADSHIAVAVADC